MKEKLSKYPKTGLFEVADTIGVPHTFCMGSEHIAHASSHFRGDLGKDAVESLEKTMGSGSSCRVRGCNLSYAQHETALLVKCGTEDKKLTQEYLESIVKQCEADGFAGFTLMLSDKYKQKENQL